MLLTYSLSYYDNAEQEDSLDEKVEEILGSLELDEMSEAEKTEAVYRYTAADGFDIMKVEKTGKTTEESDEPE